MIDFEKIRKLSEEAGIIGERSKTDYERLLETAAECGLKIVSDDTCCKVLAWLYVLGGGYEVSYNTKLLADIRYAQKRINIFGSETPDATLCELLQMRVKELEKKQADWISEIKERYKLPEYAVRLK